MKNVFLTEILTEELPAKKLKILAEKFVEQISCKFYENSIAYEKLNWFASPRRLAVKFTNIRIVNKKIFSYREPYYLSKRKILHHENDNNEQYHLQKFSKLNFNKQGKSILYKKKIKKLLFLVIRDVLINFKSIEKMQWNNTRIPFIRPIHGITLLLNDQLINGKILDIKIDRILHGHRFIGKKRIYLEHASYYSEILFKEKVMVDFFQRKEKIIFELKNISQKVGGTLKINEILLEEVVSLTEWPVVLYTSFEKKFLSIPKSILIFLLQKKQKCFPIFDIYGNLLPYFIFVINLEPKNTEKIISIYKNAVHSCFSDVKFLLNIDRNKKLADRFHNLRNITFHKSLGSLKEKSKRIARIANFISNFFNVNKKNSSRAGLLCKCDLTTNMVIEFPDMRGTIGMYYSALDGEPEEVSISQKYHYYPRFSKDILPNTLISCIISIADRIDTIVGMIGIGKIPKHGKDPFALRRAAIGIIRIIIEKKLKIDLFALIKKTIKIYRNKLINRNTELETYNFIFHRLIASYKENKYNEKIIQSVVPILLGRMGSCLLDFNSRVLSIYEFFVKDKIREIILVNKRIKNILNKHADNIGKNINTGLLISIEETNVFNFLIKINKKIPIFIKKLKYIEFLVELKNLCILIDSFFKNVLVITEDISIQRNRLYILKISKDTFLKFTDFSQLSIE